VNAVSLDGTGESPTNLVLCALSVDSPNGRATTCGRHMFSVFKWNGICGYSQGGSLETPDISGLPSPGIFSRMRFCNDCFWSVRPCRKGLCSLGAWLIC